MSTRTIHAIFALLILLFACSEESPFVSEEEAKKIIREANLSRDPFHFVTDVVAIIDNDIYYFARLDSVPKRLTSTPSQLKTHVKLSADKTQIAYINGAGHPVIINASNGAVIKTLTAYDFVTQMDWTQTGKTLYILSGQEIYTHGDPLEIQQPEETDPWDEVASFSMNAKGDYGYFIRPYGAFSYQLQYYSDDNNMSETFGLFDGDRYDYIDFYDNKGNFLLGYSGMNGGYSRVICVEDYEMRAAYEWDYESMNTPEFNSELEILLYGTLEDQVYQIKAVYLGTEAYDGNGIYDMLSKTLTAYTSNTPVYLDWRQ